MDSRLSKTWSFTAWNFGKFSVSLAASVIRIMLLAIPLHSSISHVSAAEAESKEPSASLKSIDCDALFSQTDDHSISDCGDPNVWDFSAGSLFLRKHTPSSSSIIQNAINGSEQINPAMLNSDYHAGLDVSVRRKLWNPSNSIEIRYFGIDSWNTSFSNPTSPGDVWQINTSVPIFTVVGNTIDASYHATLQNVEANVLHATAENVTLFTGFRYAEFDEGYSNNFRSMSSVLFTQTSQNRLYGGQIGCKLRLFEQRWISFSAIGKAGLYGNRASQNATINTPATTLQIHESANATSFIGELGILGTVLLTERLSFVGGYSAYSFTDLAIATDQLPNLNFSNGTAMSTSGELLVYGASAGLQYSW